MENFNFYSPTFFAFGKDCESDCGELVKRFGGSKVLIHYGGGSVVRSGLLDRVKDSLQKASVDFVELGGGSTIDSSKAIAAGVVYDGDFWNFYQGKGIEEALPVGTILTIAAAGSEGSPDSVITNEDGMIKRGASGDAIRPKFSILNPALTETLPAYQTACGITDIVAHLYERYLTNSKDVEVTDRLIESLILTMKTEAPKVMANLEDYEARANIMWAGMVAHNNIVGVGRSQDWTSHQIEHELSALYDCAHGAGLAVTMPAVFIYNLSHDVMRFAQIAVRVWGCQMDFANPERTAKEGIEALRNFFISLGMPKNFEELGAREEDIEKMAYTCCYGKGNEGGKIGGFVTLEQKDVEAIYKLMV